MISVLVALGGGLGAVARFAVDGALAERNRSGFPLGTAAVNLTGSFLIGLLLVWVAGYEGTAIAEPVYAALGTGFLGGYTTFSTASVEGVRLMSEGHWVAGFGHALGMLLVCYLAAFFGMMIGLVVAFEFG